MFVSSEQLMVTGGNFYQTTSGNIRVIQQSALVQDSKGFDLLSKNVATSALHNSGQLSDPPKCHPGTRVAILDALVEWGAAENQAFPIKWMHGPAGTGKTAIVRTLAEILASRGLLLAAFFFFRTDSLRNGPQYLVSTLAFQICLAIPQTRPHIERAIETNPLIFSLSISQQIQTLIITPFNLASSDPSFNIDTYSRVILIDGLDECLDREKQQEILQVFSENINRFSPPIAILVASRPEHHIRATFDLGRLNKSSSRLSLDDSFQPDVDIRKFYLDKFLDIRTSHPLRAFLPPAWPRSDTLDLLIRKASGQFIYASTVVKFVSSIRHDPSTRLEILLGVLDRGNLKPFEQLDLLYITIFYNLEPLDLVATLRFLGIILTPPSFTNNECRRSPRFLEELLGMKAGEPQRLLLDLESLLTIVDYSKDVHVFHSSLSDFLFDKSRSGEFFLDKGDVYANLVAYCVGHMDSAYAYNMRGYIIDNLPSYSSQASPTQNLHDMLMLSEIKRMCTVHPGIYRADGFRRVVPTFLEAIKSSKFVDAQLMYTFHRQKFMEILRPRLALYQKPPDDDQKLRVMAASIGRSNGQLQSFFRHMGKTLSSHIIKFDRQDGLHFLKEYPESQASIFPYLDDLLDELGGSSDKGCSIVADAHASLAVDLLMSVVSSMYRSSSLEAQFGDHFGGSSTFGKWVQQLLPVIIDRSSLQTDLTELIQRPFTCFRDRKYYLTEEISASFARYNKRLKVQENRQKEDSGVQLKEATNGSAQDGWRSQSQLGLRVVLKWHTGSAKSPAACPLLDLRPARPSEAPETET